MDVSACPDHCITVSLARIDSYLCCRSAKLLERTPVSGLAAGLGRAETGGGDDGTGQDKAHTVR